MLADPNAKRENHHIIPRHAGGSNAEWNQVKVSPEDHQLAHELRYQWKEEFGDYNVLQTCGPETMDRIGRNAAHEATLLAQRQQAPQKARVKIPGDDGSLSSKAVLDGLTPEVKMLYKERHQSQMSDPVKNVVQKGATFIHVETGIKVILKPREAPTLTEVAKLLAAALPVGHVNRNQLASKGKKTG